MRAGRLLLLAVILVTAASTVVAASASRCRLENVLPISSGLDALVTPVSLEGKIVPIGNCELIVDGRTGVSARSRRPLPASEERLHLVIAVEISMAYADATDAIREALRSFLVALPPNTQGQIIRFGRTVDHPSSFQSIERLLTKVDGISPGQEGDIRLSQTISQALAALESVPADPGEPGVWSRRMIVVLSDGLNPKMDREVWRKLGEDLARAGVPLFAIGFSPTDVRGPLRNLGDLSKRSAGTFRWARRPDELQPLFVDVANELRAAVVLHFPWAQLAGGTVLVRVQCGNMVSNPRAVTVRAFPRWLLGLGSALAFLASVLLWLWRRRAPVLLLALGRTSGRSRIRVDAKRPCVLREGDNTCEVIWRPATSACAGSSVLIVRAGHIQLNRRSVLGTVRLKHQDCIGLGEETEYKILLRGPEQVQA